MEKINQGRVNNRCNLRGFFRYQRGIFMKSELLL